MSRLGIDSALWGVYTSAEHAERFRREAEAYLAGFDLTTEEHRAVAEQDFAALLRLGAHPFLMYKMALRLEGAFSFPFLERYLGPLQGLELRDIVT